MDEIAVLEKIGYKPENRSECKKFVSEVVKIFDRHFSYGNLPPGQDRVLTKQNGQPSFDRFRLRLVCHLEECRGNTVLVYLPVRKFDKKGNVIDKKPYTILIQKHSCFKLKVKSKYTRGHKRVNTYIFYLFERDGCLIEKLFREFIHIFNIDVFNAKYFKKKFWEKKIIENQNCQRHKKWILGIIFFFKLKAAIQIFFYGFKYSEVLWMRSSFLFMLLDQT